LVLALLLIGLAGAIAADLLRRHATGDAIHLGHRDVAVGIAAMLAVPVLFEILGAYLTLGLFSAALLILIGRVSVMLAAPAAVIGMVGVWCFFKILLGLQLPAGPF
jgi:hypothetical protein